MDLKSDINGLEVCESIFDLTYQEKINRPSILIIRVGTNFYYGLTYNLNLYFTHIFYALKTVYIAALFFQKYGAVSALDRIFSARIVYFRPKTIYFPPGPDILPRPYIFKDRIFYFSRPYILLSNRLGFD